MDLASAVPIIIAGPFVDPVTDGGMGQMAPMITLPFIGVEDRALPRHILGDEISARAPVCVVAHPKALLAGLTRQHTDDGRTIIGIGAMSLALIRAPAWRILGSRWGVLFFPRVLIQFIRLKGDAGHHPGRRG